MRYDIIINGDTLAEMRKLQSESVDLIFADPPYYMRTEGVMKRDGGNEFDGCDDEWDKFDSPESYETFTFQWLSECRRLLRYDGSIWVIGSMQCIYTLGWIMHKLGYWFINDVIWHKTNPAPNFLGTRLNNSHETLIWAVKDKSSRLAFNYKTAKILNAEGESSDKMKQMGSVWSIPLCSGSERLKDDDGNKLHSTQKPLRLLERIIAISSNHGDIILDPFGGTMTTGAAAKKLGRRYIMIEREKKYCDYGQKRLDAIEFEDTDTARAIFDIKPPKVSMQEMIRGGAFTVGEEFMLEDRMTHAVLQEDGKLLYEGEIFDMHTCAALAKGSKRKRLNGFDVWYVMRNGELVSINSVRESYRKAE